MANKTFNPRFEDSEQDPLGSSLENLIRQEISPAIDRRAFLMRSALVAQGAVRPPKFQPVPNRREYREGRLSPRFHPVWKL
jgi:hypothetical protein